MLDAELMAELNHPLGRALPVGGLCDRQVIYSADLVQIDERVRLAHDLKTGFDIDSRFQTYPGEDASW